MHSLYNPKVRLNAKQQPHTHGREFAFVLPDLALYLSVSQMLQHEVMIGAELPKSVVLITGWGKHSKQTGESEVKVLY